MAFDEQELNGQEALALAAERRATRTAVIGMVSIICIALVLGTANHTLTFLVLALGGLGYTWLYRRILVNAPTYKHIYRICQAHYRGIDTSSMLPDDIEAGQISVSEQQKFEELVRVFREQ